MKTNKAVTSFLSTGLLLASPLTYATNGMNLESYGSVSQSMGGASMAYDNGPAAAMNNPATLGLMSEGSRIDAALSILVPSISAKLAGSPPADSSATAFYLPTIGYAHKAGKMTYGAGIFSQGGMGTDTRQILSWLPDQAKKYAPK
jgi:long-chain fatty acid transport protein